MLMFEHEKEAQLASRLSNELFQLTTMNQLHQLAELTIEEIKATKISLLQVIESLEANISSTDARNREKAIHFITFVLQGTYPVYSIQEIQLLFTFLTNQLSESSQVPSIMQGLLTLVEHSQIFEKSLLLLVKKVFADVNIQQHPQAVRYSFFRIFDLAITNHFEYIRSALKNDLVLGFISAMDGEKDPRNLMIIFKIIHFLAKSLSLGDCTQDLFEITFCYFPITFKPPPDDPYGISPQDLKLALAQCLSATPDFAEFALPCLFEKLESTNINAKRDTLTVLCMALPVYGPSHLISKEESVWRILKAEIFHSVDATYEKLALKTLETILKVLSAAEPPSPSLAMMKSNDIISAPCLEECFQYLQQPDTKLAKLAGFVFQAFISSNVTIANYLLPHIFPFLVTHINSFQQPSLKKTYIDALSEVLIGCKEHTPFPVTLRPMYQDIFKHFYDASQSFSLSLQLAGFKGIFHLLSIPGLLDFENQKMYITCLTDILMHSVEELREMSIESLSELSIHQPLLIQTWVLPELFSKLKSKETWNNNILNPLVALSKSQDLFPFILSSLVDLIGTAPEESLSSLLSTILLVLNSSKTILTASLKSTIHISTTRKFVDNTLYSICEVASEMTRKLSSISEEESIIRLVFDQNLLSNPFTFPISACVLANMHPSVPLPLTASQFLYQALETPGLPIRYTSKWIATLINKSNDPDELLIHPSLRSRLSHVDANTFHLSLWMTKALMMRSHDAGFSYCEELISYLSSDNLEVRFQVADKLGILVEESKTVLHADSHALVKPIYKQRIFEFCISKIAVLFYNSTSDQLGVLIIALRQLLNKITKEVLLASAKELAPLLLVGLGHLSCDDASLLSFIHTFEVIILEASDIASLHVQSLVQLLLNLLDPNTRKLQIRIAVLTCLSAITQLKYSVRHPLKHIVIRGLLASLDDPKRIVRQHAVNCRSLWYLSQSD